MPTKERTQIHMDETLVENPELEKELEERQELKSSVTEYNKLNKSVKEKIRSIETPAPFRVGRFVISRHQVPAKEVSFETQASFSFTIKLAGE